MKVPIRISHTHSVGSCRNLFKVKVQQILMRLWATDCIACSLKSGSYWYGGERSYNVIHCGLDTDSLTKCANQHKSKNEILIVGRMCKEKNPLFIVEIMKELIKLDFAVHFTWCGDGELFELVNKVINEYGLESNVKMVGYTNDVTNYYSKASYLLMPSLTEGLSLSVIEAQIAGLCVFGSEAIPEEANYGCIRFLNVHQNANIWAHFIYDEINQNIHYEPNKNIIADFDMKIIANKILKEIYKC
ncbi:MAG: glycosyltransferase [Bacteroidales bacterium]|nr:glycosyltransferase [Bacteroidales bacterium]